MKMSSKTNGNVGPPADVSPPAPKKAKGNIEHIYQKKTQLEHILLRPDTYIGSVEEVTEQMWVFDDGKLVQKSINYVPGLYKIFDEILVNAADNKQRCKNMDLIKIDIDQEKNEISIWNNGTGIPVVEHKDEKMYVPTMIFGHLLTSSNFNDDEKKVTGGRNGYGAKLCNVFSTKFVVETAHRKSKKKFKQVWEKNMAKTTEPKIKEFSGDDFTKITFSPDLTKFKLTKLEDDIVALFSRRAYDIAASTKGVRVVLNGTKVPVKNFKDYVDLFLKDRIDEAGNPIKFNYEASGERWEIAVAPSENGFQQNSFVNSIATTKGGRHVDYIAEMVVKNLSETIKKKNKNGIDIKPFQIRNHLWIFINCLIENPTFDSQTKENMTLQMKLFGSKCVLTDKFYASILKSGIVENVLSWAKFKAEQALNKTSAGRKQNKVKGLPKLEDANDAGTKNSLDCTLLLTEGDSAKTIVVAGLGVVGRDKFGVFPLRGKLLNVREASTKQIMENAEINAIVKILGLQYKRKYQSIEDMRTLRYGRLMIMTDQDHDGSHIKGLIINFIHHNWPSLLKMNFMEEFITPIVKAIKGDRSHSFFSIPEFEEWKKTKADWKTYHIKYYKGLGTSTSKEAKEYFTDISRHRIKFKYDGQKDDDNITMAFSKKCVEQRKDWLTSWMENSKQRAEMGIGEDVIYNKDVRFLSYSDFVNKELVLFSNLDNERSIPCLVDGLKPGQRKVLFTCFKRNDKKEVKVAQLAGSVGEQSAYHHGEASLMSTIINLAQNYVGSNNINLLMPNGQFGTRLMGGKDHASARYIFTKLSPLARVIFHVHDDAVLIPQYDDNQKIEPEWYCPIIPMVLVNGAEGIGTGWMTKIPNFNPREIIENLERMIRDELPEPMKPWYKGFRGEILEISPQKYAANGEVSVLSTEKIEITELPINTWTQSYKENVIEPLSNGTDKVQAILTDYKEYHTDVTVKFVVSMKAETLLKFEEQGLHKVFKLQTSLNLSSMVLFDENGCLKKYESVAAILQEFYVLRLNLYSKRKEFMLGCLSAESSKLSNQARFIVEKCDGRVVVENKKRKVMIEDLFKAKYDSDPVKAWRARIVSKIQADDDDENAAEEPDEAEEGKDFEYLLGMAISSLTLERKEDLLKKRDEKLKELEMLKKKTPKNLYSDDLNVLKKELDRVEQEEEESQKSNKKKIIIKKGFNKKAELAAGPSPIGKRVLPRIDELLKKVELENKVKGKRGQKKLEMKAEVEEEDEYDRMAGHNDSLLDVLNSSGEGKGLPSNGQNVGKGLGQNLAKPGPSKKTTTTKKDGPKLKQSKLNFDKKKDVVKKKRGGGEYSFSDDMLSDDEILCDLSEDEVRPEPSRPRTQRAAAVVAAKKKYNIDSTDESKSSSEDDDDFVENEKPKKKAAISDDDDVDFVEKEKPQKKAAISDDDDDDFVVELEPPKKKPANDPNLFDKLRNSLIEVDDDDSLPPAEVAKKIPKPAAPSKNTATKKDTVVKQKQPKLNFGKKKDAAPSKKKKGGDSSVSDMSSDEDVLFDLSDDDEVQKIAPSKPRTQKAASTAATKKKDAAPSKKNKRAGFSVSDMSSDEDVLFDLSDDNEVQKIAPNKPRTQRAAATVATKKKYNVDDSSDELYSD